MDDQEETTGDDELHKGQALLHQDPPAPAGEEPSTQVSLEISAFRRVLKTRGFMALWVAQGISGIGDWVIVGVLLDTLNRMGNGSTTPLVLMLIARFLPALLFGLVAGALVDRLERKTLMILCDISRACLVIALAFANNLLLICILVFCIETFSLLFGPARDSSIPDLVESDHVMTANSMMSTSTYLTMALGTLIATVILGFAALIYKFPLISGLTTQAQFQHTFAFLVDALTFIASAMLIFTIAFPRRAGGVSQLSFKQISADLREGLKFMWTDPLTRTILGVMIIGLIGGGSLYILGAPFAQQVLDATGSKFTLILSFLLFGVVAGAAATPWLNNRLPKEKWFGRAALGFGIAMFVFALIDVYVISMVVIFLGGTLLGYLLVSAYTLLHENLDPAIRGRVFAAFQTIMRTCLLISMGVFAGVAGLFRMWIRWTPEDPVSKTVNLGVYSKSFYPAMLALMVGAVVVMVGGAIAIHSFKKVFAQTHPGGVTVEEAEPSS
ncbi:MAG: MFS transporter [Actinobacteria bacterium]|nr:MFS transporter [Actinomycetota bacterium]MBU1942329.1 MFS transporter [Actinomycetota bacterium]MBU2686885.1 MFS transporter [Actinomycetota bacterium]